MKLKREDKIQIIVGLISLALFIWGYFYKYANAPQGDKSTYFFILMSALSIYILILTDRITGYLSKQKTLEEIISSLPQGMHSIRKFEDSKSAMDYLSNKIKTAKLVKNTMIEKRDEVINQNYRSDFDSAILKTLSKRTKLEYIEVVSQNFVSKSKERAKNSKATYNSFLLPEIPTAFLNFSIIKLDANEKELIIGWSTNVTIQNQEAFLIRDTRLIDYFEHIFDSMKTLGKKIK